MVCLSDMHHAIWAVSALALGCVILRSLRKSRTIDVALTDWSYASNAGSVARSATLLGHRLYLSPPMGATVLSHKMRQSVAQKAMQIVASVQKERVPPAGAYDHVVLFEDREYWSRECPGQAVIDATRLREYLDGTVLLVFGGEKLGISSAALGVYSRCARLHGGRVWRAYISTVDAKGHHPHVSLNLSSTVNLALGMLR